jgi:hypothetical protein
MLQLAASSAIAVMLSAAAMAAEPGVSGEAAPPTGIAASHCDRQALVRHAHVGGTKARVEGADVWRGRQFVLMLGVGY